MVESGRQISESKRVGGDHTGLKAVAARLVLRRDHGDLERWRRDQNHLGVILTQANTVADRTQQQRQRDRLTGGPQVTENRTVVNET